MMLPYAIPLAILFAGIFAWRAFVFGARGDVGQDGNADRAECARVAGPVFAPFHGAEVAQS